KGCANPTTPQSVQFMDIGHVYVPFFVIGPERLTLRPARSSARAPRGPTEARRNVSRVARTSSQYGTAPQVIIPTARSSASSSRTLPGTGTEDPASLPVLGGAGAAGYRPDADRPPASRGPDRVAVCAKSIRELPSKSP